jgi:hypothetical protein
VLRYSVVLEEGKAIVGLFEAERMMWLELGELEGCENSPMKRVSILSLGSLRLIYSLSLSLTADLLIIQIL